MPSRLRLIIGISAVGLLVHASAAWARTSVRVTAGEHPRFGRVVLDAPGLSYTLSREGGRLLVRFADEFTLGELPPAPHDVQAIRAVPGGVELTVAADAVIHAVRYGDKIVIDVDDLVPGRTPPHAAPPITPPATPPATSPRTPRDATPDPASTAAAAGKPGQPLVGPSVGPAAGVPTRPASSVATNPFGPVSSQLSGLIATSPPAAAIGAAAVSAAIAAANPRAGPGVDSLAVSAPGPSATLSAVLTAGLAAGPHGRTTTPERTAETARITSTAGTFRSDSASTGEMRLSAASPAAADRPEQPRANDAVPPDHPPTTPAVAPPPSAEQASEASESTPPAQLAEHAADELSNQTEPPPTAASAGDTTSPERKEPVQVWPVIGEAPPAGPVALLAVKARPPAGLDGAAISIPFRGAVGAALFSRGTDSFAVFDERRPIDLSALRDDPNFGSAIVTIYPAATVIRLSRPANRAAMLSPSPFGWRLSLVAATTRAAAFAQEATHDAMSFAASAPGQVVAITDPRTGATLLVGTQRVSGQAMLTERRTAEFMLPVTGQGIVVEPQSDAVALRITPGGFALSGGPSGLRLSPPLPMQSAMLAAARLTRLFGFPRQTIVDLAALQKRQAITAAMTPELARGPKRHALAETMLGLGMAAEAQTLLRITMKDDPREAAQPSTVGLAAIAALLAGRPQEAADLTDPRLNGTDEIALWRAIQTAMADEASSDAAAVFATTAPLLFTYPAELRRRVLPLALETMIRGGEATAAVPLLALRKDDPGLAYARALLKQAQGDNDGALALLDALTNTRSMLDHARAAVRATELRLAIGQLDPKAAAGALDAQLDAWRGDRQELALRLRIAELRAKAGAWRPVFAVLRAAREDFPAQSAEIDRRLRDAFAAVPRDPSLAQMEPTELVALFDENAELMADGPDGEPMRELLADKLMALDLPTLADPVLTKLMRAAPFGPARAEFGATLATLRQHEGDNDGAILALSESNSSDMGDAVRDRRALITANVEAKRGQMQSAMEVLAVAPTQASEEAHAAILEQAGDWRAARDALTVLAAHMVPPSGALDETQIRVLLRLATAATRADDHATLAALAEKYSARVGTGSEADMFRLLTAAPVLGTADLVRSRTELGLARSVAADMGPKKAPAKTP